VTAVAQLRRAFDDLAHVPATAIRDASTLVEGIAEQTGRPVTIKGQRYVLTAETTIERRGAQAIIATVSGKPTGFWVWQNTGTKPHRIAPQPGRNRGRPRVIAGRSWGHPVSVAVHHPGASGRGRWRQVTQRARREVPQIFRDAVHDALQQVT
jgi:hypothetical protein